MSDRAYVFQTVRVARESGAGTAPASGYKQLRSMSIAPGIKATIDLFRPGGFKLPTVQSVGQEWSVAALTGQPQYPEIDYALSVLQQPTFATAVANASGTAYTRTYQMAAGSADARDTFTLQAGDATRRLQLSYAFLTEWGLTLTRAQSQMSGNWMGQRVSEGTAVTFGTAVAALTDVPILGNQWNVYLSPTYAGIGSAGNQLLRALAFGWSIKGRRGPIWTLNSSNSSYAADVELEPVIEIKLLVEADATGMGPLDAMRDGSSRYLRAIAAGGTITAGTAGTALFGLRSDNAVKLSAEPSPWRNEQGVYAIEWTFQAVIDTDLTGGSQWLSTTNLASL